MRFRAIAALAASVVAVSVSSESEATVQGLDICDPNFIKNVMMFDDRKIKQDGKIQWAELLNGLQKKMGLKKKEAVAFVGKMQILNKGKKELTQTDLENFVNLVLSKT